MGRSEPSTFDTVSWRIIRRMRITYQERASDQDENAVVARGLGINGVGAVLDLLEGQVLGQSALVKGSWRG